MIAAVRQFGQMRRILVRRSNMMIIAGHGLWTAMKRDGHTEADFAIADWDQKTADAYMVADNRMGQLTQDDRDALALVLADFADDADTLDAMGFDDDDLDDLLADDDEGDSSDRSAGKVRELDTEPVYDEFWITVSGPLQQQAQALKRLQDLMGEMPGVKVELGTINLDEPS